MMRYFTIARDLGSPRLISYNEIKVLFRKGLLKEMPPIAILLSTYNGLPYLAEQLDSILGQDFPEWCLYIRDDGSTDGTPQVLRRCQEASPGRIFLLEDDPVRLGAAQSFSRLMQAVSADYLMFCDQDDIWLPDKISRTLATMQAMEREHGPDLPLLVHSDLQLVDQRLEVLAPSFWRYQNLDPRRGESLLKLAIQNVVTGCTVMINRRLNELALPVPPAACMHDWWTALVAAAFGKIGFISTPLVRYRQHAANKIGAKRWGLMYILTMMVKREEARQGLLASQAQAGAFVDRYAERLSPPMRSALGRFSHLSELGFWERRYLLIQHGMFKAGLARNIGLLLWV